MAQAIERVVEIAISAGRARRSKISVMAAIDQDIGIYGDDAEDFVEALRDEFGDWIAGWPWRRFVDFDEPAPRICPRIWRLLKLPNASLAFPGIAAERLELGHIAAVIENGQWFEP